MAKVVQKKKKKVLPTELPFGKENLQILAVGLLLLVIGYVLMAQPPVNSFMSLTLSPIVLMFSYLVVIPYAIMYRPKKKEEQ
jgi:uncharacterized membrane protein HdeD (DUF308 family)